MADQPPEAASDPQSYGDVAVERLDDIAVLEIRRPPNNFFDRSLIADIADALDALADEGCRAIVLASAGRHFCAGADFSHPDDSAGPHLYEIAIRLFEQPLPIVAAIQGAAIGGGLGLAMSTDFRIGSPEARMSANFAQLGFHHGFGLSVTLPLVVGHQHALDLLYTGRRVKGEEALSMGLLDQLVAPEELRDAAIEHATSIAASAPLAVRSIRQTMRGDLVSKVRNALERERTEQDRLKATPDWREGIAAAAQRRPPVFSGA